MIISRLHSPVFDLSHRWANGDTYEGDFENGIMQGLGKLVKANGDTYEGSMLGGQKHGYGVMIYANGTATQGGIWEKNEFVRVCDPPEAAPAPKDSASVPP